MRSFSGHEMAEVLLCPITGEVMLDPVIDPEGNSYEKSAIVEWLSRTETSPVTRTPLRVDQLTPNRALRTLIESDEEAPSVTPNFNVDLEATYTQDNLGLVRVCVSDDATLSHAPSVVVCVIDVSYSMDDAATMHDDSEGSAGLSLLDVVKHATSAVIETMGDNDKLAVVAYADNAQVVLPFTPMTIDNRKLAKVSVNALTTCGSTNLYGGLLAALDLVRLEQDASNSNILLLTDGLPNIHPPRGTLPTLIRYKESHTDLSCRISTFGFGYNLDSRLLNDIAHLGGGHYGFIPDSSFVGTVFVNSISNILATALSDATLFIEVPDRGVSISKCLSPGISSFSTSWGMSVDLPNLLYGQTMNILVQIENHASEADYLEIDPIRFSASIRRKGTNEQVGTEALATAVDSNDLQIKAADIRCKILDFITKSENLIFSSDGKTQEASRNAQKGIRELQNTISTSGISVEHKGVKALEEDLRGQITEAYSRLDWHKKWGRHYLLSLARAHELQQCTNFKDPGVQVYSTNKFSLIRDVAENLFCKLPPPKPSLARNNASFSPPRSMAVYYNSNAPCFASGSVRLSDGRYVDVSEVVAGDEIATPAGNPPARIRCVVVTACEKGIADLVELEGKLLVTPWHPVRLRGTSAWNFPADLAVPLARPCEEVYSFVLEEGSGIMRIGAFEAVTLGHGIEDDPVAKHDYLGTEKVVADLSKMVGWDDGRVELAQNPAIRDGTTGLIVSFKQEAVLPPIQKDKKPLERFSTDFYTNFGGLQYAM